jgi:hypothetical protein
MVSPETMMVLSRLDDLRSLTISLVMSSGGQRDFRVMQEKSQLYKERLLMNRSEISGVRRVKGDGCCGEWSGAVAPR